MTALVHWQLNDTGVATLTWNHLARHNALSPSLLAQLVDALEALAQQQARVIVLQATPDAPVWSAGFDLTQLPRDGSDPLPPDNPLDQALDALQQFPGLVIAKISGSVWGGAVELAACCDLVIADTTATFALTPAKIGLPYSTRGVQRLLARLPLHRLMELFATAAPIDAETAQAWGLVNHCVPAEQLEEVVAAMASQIAANAPLALASVKAQTHALSQCRPLPPEILAQLEIHRRAAYRSADFQEGLQAFAEKRRPRFTGQSPSLD
jgi:methylmalonyl-CoA decarboxylase